MVRATASSYEYSATPEPALDAHGRLVPAVNRFPSSAGGRGFAPLAAEVHALGLKFGIHLMRGIPRLAQNLALDAMLAAMTAGKTTVDAAAVQQAALDLEAL